MAGFAPSLNLPSLKKKGITVMSNFPSIRSPFHVPTEVMNEGAPVKRVGSTMNIVKAVAGDGAVAIGLVLQDVYDESGLGAQYSQLAGHHFGNDTAQALNGMPVGVLMGTGYAEIRNYTGAVAINDHLGIDPANAGKVKTSAVVADQLPVWAESTGTDGDKPVRIRFDFPLTR
jgi:hypothetical protein